MQCDRCKINSAYRNKKLIIGEIISSTVYSNGQAKVYSKKYRMVESTHLYYCKQCFNTYYLKRALLSLSLIILSILLFLLNFNAEKIVINLSGFFKFVFEIYIDSGFLGYIFPFMFFILAILRFNLEDSRVGFCKKLLREQGKLPFFSGYKLRVFTEKQWNALQITSF
jgi:hypothetical protein